MDHPAPASGYLLYCRSGFESECAQDIAAAAAARGLAGHVRAARGEGVVEFVFAEPADAAALAAQVDLDELVFARQWLVVLARLDALDARDRVTPILAAVQAAGLVFSEVVVEAPDTDEGKALAPFCKSFGSALAGALRKARRIDARSSQRLHACFPRSDRVWLCLGDGAHSSAWPQGIPRLKFPREAPSRSTLKLDEALLVLLDEDERARWLQPGMSAVDLGAAPGGWTWQLVQRGLRVTAIDNGPMDAALLDTGLVTHLRADGFRYLPRKPVDWLVCDMVEQPRRVATLIAQWLADGHCRRTVFNLKLPMKKRHAETQECLGLVAQVLGGGPLRARQLYHDREEITAFAARA